jgi:DNA polymerase-1
MKRLLLIDTFNFLHRAYHALPKTFTDKNGEPTNAVYGVTSMLINLFDLVKPNYVVAALDGTAPTFRVEEFTGYKAHRKPMEENLSSQIPKVLEVLDAFGIKQEVVNGYEADDIIGTLDKKFGDKNLEIVIVSNDRDLWQLVDGNTVIMVPNSKSKPTLWLGPKEVKARLGFEPKLLVDYKGLRGDPSDNIPGIKGIGDKTATQLVMRFGSIDNIYKNIAKIDKKVLKEKLIHNYEQAQMSRRLATIVLDVPVDITLDECKYHEVNKLKVKEVLEKYNFKSLIKRLGFPSKPKKQEVAKNQLELF